MISMSLFNRSPHLSKIHKLLTTYLKASNIPAKVYDTLHHFGLALGQKWAYNSVNILAHQAREAMLREVKNQQVMFGGHDNLNIAFKVQEQRLNNKSHFDSGTAATLYISKNPDIVLPNALAYRLQRHEGRTNPITYADILRLEIAAKPRIKKLALWHILTVLFDAPAFNFSTYDHRKHPAFARPTPWRQVSSDPRHKTVQYMLRTIHEEEASYSGTDRVLHIYEPEVDVNTPEERQHLGLNRLLVWVGDQLTVSRIRGLQQNRAGEANSYERLEHLLSIPGWFHTQMNLAVNTRQQHYGTKTTYGLAHAFEVLNRKGLHSPATQGIFHHTLEEAMYHVAIARLRDIWRLVGKSENLSELRSKSPEEIVALAENIYTNYASMGAVVALEDTTDNQRDDLLRNSVMFNRDILDYMILDEAISSGDTGTMEDFLPRLLFRFVGGKNSLYSIEILELIQGLHREWPNDVK
jgi:hypothetical protein